MAAGRAEFSRIDGAKSTPLVRTGLQVMDLRRVLGRRGAPRWLIREGIGPGDSLATLTLVEPTATGIRTLWQGASPYRVPVTAIETRRGTLLLGGIIGGAPHDQWITMASTTVPHCRIASP